MTALCCWKAPKIPFSKKKEKNIKRIQSNCLFFRFFRMCSMTLLYFILMQLSFEMAYQKDVHQRWTEIIQVDQRTMNQQHTQHELPIPWRTREQKKPHLQMLLNFQRRASRGNDINKREKNADDKREEELHSAIVKADYARLKHINDHDSDDHEWKELKKACLDKMKRKFRNFLSKGEND